MASGGAEAALEARVDQLASQLRQALEVKSGFADPARQAALLARHFAAFDRDASGAVDFDEFRRAMERLHFVGVQRELEALFDRFDVDLDGTISYQEFASGVVGLGGCAAAVVANAPSASVAGVRDRILAAGGKNGVRSLGVILRRMDQNGDGVLELEEFRDGLEQLGVRAGDYRREGGRPDEVARAFRFFDRDGSGRITTDELMRGLRGTMSKRRILLVRQAFARLDASGDGRATLEEVAKRYDASQHPDVLAGSMTPRDALLDLMRVFERPAAGSDADASADTVEGDGVISWHEFLEYYRELSAGVRGDDEFELMVRNAWHLSGGEGWSANSTCRRVLATLADGSQRVLEVADDLGVGARDSREMLRRLRAQGHCDVVAVELAH